MTRPRLKRAERGAQQGESGELALLGRLALGRLALLERLAPGVAAMAAVVAVGVVVAVPNMLRWQIADVI